ncbi:pilus assembly FimT family protein [Inhella proteolytica]|uniref:Type II secretion system protein H n=1 Tax=Inhella proteolytica TaxID=2795029 RepID=A0A931J2T3_9BURK|nr:GspH/FimT family pseudopilin [Inhella proteolytica]MBH9575877.1 prepilin-type N-terminal cleavage/methylation domain-containing protein [Inhella proteolytica]
MTPRSLRGFNLLEMGVTLAVLAVLITLAAPTYNRYQQRQQLRLAGDALARDALAAREAAIAQGRPAFLVLKGGETNWCWGVSVAAPCDCRQAVRACRIATHHAQEHRNVQVRRDQQLEWNPSLGHSGSLGQITLTSTSGESLTLKLDAQGRPNACGSASRTATPC